MSYIINDTVTITTDSSGDATSYSVDLTGYIQNIIYTKDDFADGVDFTITNNTTGETIWTEENVNASKTVAPRQATHSTAGVASLYAAAGTAVQDRLALANQKIKIVIGSGGSLKSGTFTFIIA